MAKKTRGARMRKFRASAKATKGGKGKISKRPKARRILKT